MLLLGVSCMDCNHQTAKDFPRFMSEGNVVAFVYHGHIYCVFDIALAVQKLMA